MSQSSKTSAPSRMHSNALVWSMRTKVDTLHMVACSKAAKEAEPGKQREGKPPPSNPEFTQNRERRAVGGDHQS